MQLSQSHYEKKESEEEFLQNLKSLKEELKQKKLDPKEWRYI